MSEVLPRIDVSTPPEPLTFGEKLWPAFNALRVPLGLALLACLVLIVPEQVREIYRVLVQERLADGAFKYRWLLALGSLTLFTLVLWQVARLFANVAILSPDVRHARLSQGLLDWGPRAIAVSPLLGASLGVLLSRSVPSSDGLTKAPGDLLQIHRRLTQLGEEFLWVSLVLFGLAVLVMVATTLFERVVFRPKGLNSRKLTVLNLWLLFPVTVLASIGYILSQPVAVPQYFGALPVFALWMVNLSVVVTLLSRYYSIAGIPMMILLVGWVLVIDYFGFADNHAFRSIPVASTAGPRPDVSWMFDEWLANRADRDLYAKAGQPYPVYVVAAEGGGLYAAYQSAKFLTHAQDLCPRFAQHVFTISSVSGGSLGAGVFAGLAKTNARNAPDGDCSAAPSGEMERRASAVLAGDFLSPVIWGALFTDGLQRFIPYPIGAFDRARSLEYAFEDAWANGLPGPNPMREPFFDICGANSEACTKGATPLLALNTTHVETGLPVVLSPARFTEVGKPWTLTATLRDFFFTGQDVNMPLSTAIGLSARFPWLSPGGWHEFATMSANAEDSRPVRATFADGAYVDNSGIITASKLVQYLRARLAAKGQQNTVAFKIITVGATALDPFDSIWVTGGNTSPDRQSELLLPLQAALTAQWGRSYTARNEAGVEVDQYRILPISFAYSFMDVPLGWQLSALSRAYIDLFAGSPANCVVDAGGGANLNTLTDVVNSTINANNCSLAEIVKDLRPTAAAAGVSASP